MATISGWKAEEFLFDLNTFSKGAKVTGRFNDSELLLSVSTEVLSIAALLVRPDGSKMAVGFAKDPGSSVWISQYLNKMLDGIDEEDSSISKTQLLLVFNAKYWHTDPRKPFAITFTK